MSLRLADPTHLPGESPASPRRVPGGHRARRAEVIDIHASEHAEFKQTVLDIHTPRYGEEWAAMLDGGAWYARINPRRMFTFWMPDDGT